MKKSSHKQHDVFVGDGNLRRGRKNTR